MIKALRPIGFLLVSLSIVASIFFRFHYWYSFYVIGSFLLFGTLNYERKNTSVFSYLLKRNYLKFFIVYSLGVSIGFFVDIVYGRNIASLWYYPHINGVWNFLIPVFIYYPFGGLQVYEIFYFLHSIIPKSIPSTYQVIIPQNFKMSVAILLAFFILLGFMLPVVNFFRNNNYRANELMIVIMALTVFSGDALVYLMRGKSIVFDFLQGNKRMILTMILSWFLCTVLTEVPNTFSYEWIYYNIPFTHREIFHINILIFTIGWFFLVFVPVRFIDFVRILFRLDTKN